VLRPAAKPSRAGYLIGESVLSLAVAHTRPRHLDRIDPEEALESFDATLDYLDFPQSLTTAVSSSPAGEGRVDLPDFISNAQDGLSGGQAGHTADTARADQTRGWHCQP
jgi:hypothetical protein